MSRSSSNILLINYVDYPHPLHLTPLVNVSVCCACVHGCVLCILHWLSFVCWMPALPCFFIAKNAVNLISNRFYIHIPFTILRNSQISARLIPDSFAMHPDNNSLWIFLLQMFLHLLAPVLFCTCCIRFSSAF